MEQREKDRNHPRSRTATSRLRRTGAAASLALPAAGFPALAAAADGAGDGGFPLARLLLAAGAIAVLLAIRHLLRRGTRHGSAEPTPAPRSALGKRRLAQRLVAQRRYREAGDLYLEAGQVSAALDAYLQGGASERAARLLESQGDLEEAARAFEAAGAPLEAARLWLRLGQPASAARCHAAAAQWAEAARLWTAAGEHVQAAEALRKKGDLGEAALSYQRAGRFERAGELYRLKVAELRNQHLGPADLAEPARLAGRMFESARLTQQAVDSYLEGGLEAEAARVLAAAGRSAEAGKLLLELGRLEEAIEQLELGGEATQVKRLEAKQAMAAGDPGKAADLLLAAGERQEAAAMLCEAKRFAEAARLYQELGDPLAAAPCFEAAGDEASAAAALEQAGNLPRAAALYHAAGRIEDELRLLRRLGEGLAVARLQLERGERSAAEEELKAIPRSSKDFRAASMLLGDLYRARDDAEAAAIKYRQALEGQPLETASLEDHYKLALAAEQAGQLDLALATWTAMVEVDPCFRDCRQRIEAHKRKLQATRHAPPPPLELTEVVAHDGEEGQELAGELELDRTLPLERKPTGELVRSPSVPIPVPLTVPRYEPIERIGDGPFCEVYRARDTVLDREVAYKRYPAELAAGATPATFLRQARTAAKLNHVHAVTVFDAGIEPGGAAYIAMELVDGEPLAAMVEQRGPLGLRFISSVLRQSCDVLAAAHERGIIHRDIRPANMMWTSEGLLKITDFGLARSRDDSSLESRGPIIGTPHYMSPEQIKGEPLDPRTDIYSLGVTVFELTCGRVPFREGKILEQHLHAAPPRPTSLRPDCPGWLEEAILWCMEKDRGSRPTSPKELWRTVEVDASSV